MEIFKRFNSTHSWNHSLPAKDPRASVPQVHNHLLARDTFNTSRDSHEVNTPSPSTKLEDPLRVAMVISNPRSFQTLSLLEQIPGIEIVGIAEKQIQGQESAQRQNRQNSFATPTRLLLNHTSPHLLLKFTDEPHVPGMENQEQNSNTEISGPYTALLLEKIADHKNGLERQMTQIEQLANIGTLTSGILHNISNPLYVILGFSEILLDEAPTPAVREQILEVLQAAKRIIAMCRDLNLYARQTTSQECTRVDLTQQLEEALKVARFSVGMENMTIIRRFAGHPIILARPEEILQIFVNLIVNALQAMEGEGILTLEIGGTDQMATISIKDTGPGIPHSHMQKIFDPFFTTKPPGKGTGLGLHSVRSLVQHYGGHIFFHSVVGEGTAFHLEFAVPSEPEPGRSA
jgi:two-component system, NtrC family, sensor kinase